eukprot:TRINITY_DN7218_c0_g1_i1.p1 TRINITY_DN7218_c0_g1~~TRINITY_DN7218_c0_g1_i1.p1  ORF type:complete len:574 (+),score=79.03 TRINITY_DN7218_c0_g1_i1:330-2051(+)
MSCEIVDGDQAWVLVSSALVCLMTPGLAFFYGGLVRQANFLNTLFMSFMCMGIITVEWVFVGYTFSFGWRDKGFGDGRWVGLRDVGEEPHCFYAPTISHSAFMIFQMMFAIITPAIISGAIVERITFRAWVLFVIFWSLLVYNPIAHWVWSGVQHADGTIETGLLRDLGALDFAGGTVVHISSGYAGLVASLIVGPRRSVNLRAPPEGHNIPLFILGVSLLWVGWFGFNSGSALAAGGLASTAFVNTHICAATSMASWMLFDMLARRAVTIVGPLSGAIVGLVVITPAAGYVHVQSALALGFIGAGVVYVFVLLKARFLNGRRWTSYFDDSLDVFCCHGIGGTVGALLTGFFASTDVNPAGADGVLFGGGKLLAYQLAAILLSIVHTCVGTAVILIPIKLTLGLRYTREEENFGLDLVGHKQIAYRIKNLDEGENEHAPKKQTDGLGGSRIIGRPINKAYHIVADPILGPIKRLLHIQESDSQSADTELRTHGDVDENGDHPQRTLAMGGRFGQTSFTVAHKFEEDEPEDDGGHGSARSSSKRKMTASTPRAQPAKEQSPEDQDPDSSSSGSD